MVPEKEEVPIKMGTETLANKIIAGKPQCPQLCAINVWRYFFFIPGVLFASLLVQCAFSAAPGAKIIGGSKAAEKQFPYQVSLQYRGSHVCGATIYDEKNIVTAAHCCASESFLWKLFIGRSRQFVSPNFFWQLAMLATLPSKLD